MNASHICDIRQSYGVKYRAVGQVWHVGTHFSFLFSIYSENHGVQAEPLNFTRSSDITYVKYLCATLLFQRHSILLYRVQCTLDVTVVNSISLPPSKVFVVDVCKH